jgi:hypothetical protein
MKKLVLLVLMLFARVIADDFKDMLKLDHDEDFFAYRLVPSVEKLSSAKLYNEYLEHIRCCLRSNNVLNQRYSLCVDCRSFNFMANTNDIVFLREFIKSLYFDVIDYMKQKRNVFLPESVYTIDIILPTKLSKMISLRARQDFDVYGDYETHWEIMLTPKLDLLQEEESSYRFLQRVQKFFRRIYEGFGENIVVGEVDIDDQLQNKFISELRLFFQKLKCDLTKIQFPEELMPKKVCSLCLHKKA